MSKGHLEALREMREKRWEDKDFAEKLNQRVLEGHDPLVTRLVTKVTAVVTPKSGQTCPMCGCKVPARLSAAERQRASRANRKKA